MLRRISVPIILIALAFAVSASALDYDKLKPSDEDLKRVEQFRYLDKTQEGAEKAQGLIDNNPNLLKPGGKAAVLADLKPEMERAIFYLFSKSVPDVTIDSIFKQATKMKGASFYGVIRGIDTKREIIDRLLKLKSMEKTTVKMNPLIFRAVDAQVVPAFVYGICPKDFRTDLCEFKIAVFGDMTLKGALEIMADHDDDVKVLYEEMKNAF